MKQKVLKYQVGCLTEIKKNDPEFDSLDEAKLYAVKKSVKSEKENTLLLPFGIWTGQDFGSELLYIAYGNQLYIPESI